MHTGVIEWNAQDACKRWQFVTLGWWALTAGQSMGVYQLHSIDGIYWRCLGHPDGAMLGCALWHLLYSTTDVVLRS